MVAGDLRRQEDGFAPVPDRLADDIFRTVYLRRVDQVRAEVEAVTEGCHPAAVAPGPQSDLRYLCARPAKVMKLHAMSLSAMPPGNVRSQYCVLVYSRPRLAA